MSLRGPSVPADSHQRVGEVAGLEGAQVLGRFADADGMHGQAETLRQDDRDAVAQSLVP